MALVCLEEESFKGKEKGKKKGGGVFRSGKKKKSP